METALYRVLLEEESCEGQRTRRGGFHSAHCLRISPYISRLMLLEISLMIERYRQLTNFVVDK